MMLVLVFLTAHQATACNTWFQKDIHMATWQHPKSKSWFCIDYILMKQRDKKLYMDVAVKRGAECNTDHHAAELRMVWRCSGRRVKWVDLRSQGCTTAARGRGSEVPE